MTVTEFYVYILYFSKKTEQLFDSCSSEPKADTVFRSQTATSSTSIASSVFYSAYVIGNEINHSYRQFVEYISYTVQTNMAYIFTPHVQNEQGKVIGVGVHVYVCGQQKLNRTLAIYLPFQIFTVGLLVEFID